MRLAFCAWHCIKHTATEKHLDQHFSPLPSVGSHLQRCLPLLQISSSSPSGSFHHHRAQIPALCWHAAQARDSSPDAEQTSTELNAIGKHHNALLPFLKREKGAQDDALDNNHYYAEDLRKIMLIGTASVMLISPTAIVPAHFLLLPDTFLETASTPSHVYLGRMLTKKLYYFQDEKSRILMINKVPRKQCGSDTLYVQQKGRVSFSEGNAARFLLTMPILFSHENSSREPDKKEMFRGL